MFLFGPVTPLLGIMPYDGGAWLPQSAEHQTLDLGIVSSIYTLGIEIT